MGRKYIHFPSAIARVANVVMWIGQSNDSGLSPRTGLASQYFNTDSRIKSWDQTSGVAATYSLGTIGGNGSPTGANDHAITKAIVPSYDNGIGPDVGFVKAWKDDSVNIGKELFVFKIDLTPPASTNGKSIKAWLDGTDGVPALFPDFLVQWNSFKSYLTSQGYTSTKTTFICGIGEQDSSNYLSSTTGGTNPDFAGSLTTFVNTFRTNGVLTVNSRVLIAQKQRAQDTVIATAQAAYVSANATVADLVSLPYPTFLPDSTHYDQDSILRLGELEYGYYVGQEGLETSQSSGTWQDATFSIPSTTTVSGNIYSTSNTIPAWVNGGIQTVSWRAPGTEARVRMQYLNQRGVNSCLAFDGDSTYVAQTGPNANGVYNMEYMFFITNTGTVGIHRYGVPVNVIHPVRFGRYYCIKINAAGRVTVEESIDGFNWVVFYVFPQAAVGGYYAQMDLIASPSQLQYPQTLNFSAIGGSTGTVLETFDAYQGWTYAGAWTQYTKVNATDCFGDSIYYTSTDGDAATRTIVVTQPSVLKLFSNRATGYGTGIVKLNGVQLGTAWSANGPAANPDPVNPVYTSPTIQPGTYTLSVVNTVLDPMKAVIVIDRASLYAV